MGILNLEANETRAILRALDRIADAMELQLKLQAVKAGITLSQLKEVEEEMAAPPSGKGAMEVLQQTPEELQALEHVHSKLVERFGEGNVPLGLDLYAELAKERADNPDEEP
jgi:hypothetical protein